MTNAVILISGSGSNLQAIIDQAADHRLPIDIKLVISNNGDAYGLQRAREANIPTACIDHHEYGCRSEFDQALRERVDEAEPHIVILAGFMRILTADFVNHYQNRLVNIHPSLLPDHPGNNTHQRVLDAQDKWHGVSIHFVVPEVDSGPIILQGRLLIKPDDTASTLQQRIHKIEHKLYPLAIRWFAEGRLSIIGERVLLDGKTSDDQLQSFDL